MATDRPGKPAYTFQGRDEAEALEHARAVMGSAFRLIESRPVRGAEGRRTLFGGWRGDAGGAGGAGGAAGVEVVVAPSEPAPPATALPKGPVRGTGGGGPGARRRPVPLSDGLFGDAAGFGPPSGAPPAPPGETVQAAGPAAQALLERLSSLEERVLMGQDRDERRFAELRRLMVWRRQDGLPRADGPWLSAYDRLLERGFRPGPALGLVEAAAAASGPPGDLASCLVLLRDRLAERLAVAPPPLAAGRTPPRVLAFVGPPGMGKSVASQKAAFGLYRRQPGRLALVEVNPDHPPHPMLAGCARVLGLPHSLVATPDQAREAFRQLADAGVGTVVVDTPGQRPGDGGGLARLAQFLTTLKTAETCLVLGADMDRRAAWRAVGDYAPLRANRWVLSRMDCADRYPLLSMGMDRAGEAEEEDDAPAGLGGRRPGAWAWFSAGTALDAGWREAEAGLAARLALGMDGPGALDAGAPLAAGGADHPPSPPLTGPSPPEEGEAAHDGA